MIYQKQSPNALERNGAIEKTNQLGSIFGYHQHKPNCNIAQVAKALASACPLNELKEEVASHG